MTFTHELYEERREDKEEGEGIGQLLLGNHRKHRKRRLVAQASDICSTSQQKVTQHTRCIIICWDLPLHQLTEGFSRHSG